MSGSGARAFALGQAYVAVPGDAEAVWYNPAAGARPERLAASVAHARLYPGLDQGVGVNALAVVVPAAGGGVQGAASILATDGWREVVVVGGYGREVRPGLALGGALRSSGWEAGRLSHRVWSADLGGTYDVGWVHPGVHLRLGALAGNLAAPRIAASGHGGGTSRRWALGACVETAVQLLTFEVARCAGQTELSAGYETKVADWRGAMFRIGGRAFSSQWGEAELDVGLGYGWRQWKLDYAFTYPMELTGWGGIHWITIGYRPD